MVKYYIFCVITFIDLSKTPMLDKNQTTFGFIDHMLSFQTLALHFHIESSYFWSKFLYMYDFCLYFLPLFPIYLFHIQVDR